MSAVRLPLQVGTSYLWNAGAAAASIFPALAMLGGPFVYAGADGLIAAVLVGVLLAGPMLFGGIGSLTRLGRARASDLEIDETAVTVVGGALGHRRFAFDELRAPYLEHETVSERRLSFGVLMLGVLVLVAMAVVALLLMILTNSEIGKVDLKGLPLRMSRDVDVSRLYLHTARGEQLVIAETEDPEEAASMAAAAESVDAVARGVRYVQQAAAAPAEILACPACGAPAVPGDAPRVACAHCGAAVAMTDHARSLAAAAEAMRGARVLERAMVARMLAAPTASKTHARLRAVLAAMLLAWPIGWTLVASRVASTGWSASAVVFLCAPVAGVLGGAFLGLAALADRVALRVLTLGFGALAPARPGAPARCRRCLGPLAAADGVAVCGYCGADNVVGIDLRPAIAPARAEQATLAEALEKDHEAQVSRRTMVVLAVVMIGGWIAATIGFAVGG